MKNKEEWIKKRVAELTRNYEAHALTVAELEWGKKE